LRACRRSSLALSVQCRSAPVARPSGCAGAHVEMPDSLASFGPGSLRSTGPYVAPRCFQRGKGSPLWPSASSPPGLPARARRPSSGALKVHLSHPPAARVQALLLLGARPPNPVPVTRLARFARLHRVGSALSVPCRSAPVARPSGCAGAHVEMPFRRRCSGPSREASQPRDVSKEAEEGGVEPLARSRAQNRFQRSSVPHRIFFQNSSTPCARGEVERTGSTQPISRPTGRWGRSPLSAPTRNELSA
jgi:hypothetical protein